MRLTRVSSRLSQLSVLPRSFARLPAIFPLSRPVLRKRKMLLMRRMIPMISPSVALESQSAMLL